MLASRRTFVIQSLAGTGALAALSMATKAQAQSAVSDSEPQAMALGYQSDGSKTDLKKYPNYAAGQSCSACALFQAKAPGEPGNCGVFANRLVANKGWCSAWTKRG